MQVRKIVVVDKLQTTFKRFETGLDRRTKLTPPRDITTTASMPPAMQPESTMKSLVIYRTKPTIGTITPAVGQKSSFGNQMCVLVACL
jgi:hypothetical protein